MLGDLRAQRNSLRVGELRLVELAHRYGHEVVQAAMAEIIDRTEAKVRDAIRAIPNGVYRFEDYMDDSGPGTPPMRLEVTVTVRDDDILIDFDGTGPQTESGMNSYLNYTRSYCYAAVKCLTDPEGPQNDGAFRPVRIEAPLGSFLNPRAARGRRAARGLLLPDLRRGHRRAGARPARPGHRGRLPLRQPDLRGLRSRGDSAGRSSTSSSCPAPRPGPTGTAARRCRWRSTPRTSRWSRRRRTSPSSSSASS